jgi:hypothetical protein
MTYSHARLVKLKEKATRLRIVINDLSERCQEAREEYQRALVLRDNGEPHPKMSGSGQPYRRFPPEKEQRLNEQACADAKAERDRLHAELTAMGPEWEAAARAVTRAEEFIKEHRLEPHDRPPAEPSPFKPKPPKDGDFTRLIV